MDEKFRIDLKDDSTTSSLFLNKDSFDAYTQIVSNSSNVFQNKKRQEWVRNEPIDIMSQSNPSELRSTTPSMDSLDFNDELHHNQSESNPNDSICKDNDCTFNEQFNNGYFGKTNLLIHTENFGLPSTTSSTKQNSTSLALQEISSLQCPYHKQRQVHVNNNDNQLNERNNKNEMFFSNDISNNQHNFNLKKKKSVNIINHCDDIHSSPQFYMTQFHDFIVMQQNLCNEKLDDSSNDSIFSTQDYEYYNIEKSQNIVPCFQFQHNHESLQSVPWSNIYPHFNPKSSYVSRDDVHTIDKLPKTKPRNWPKVIPNFHLYQSSQKVMNPFHNSPDKNPSSNPKFVNKVDRLLANNERKERKVTFSMQNVRFVRTSTQYNERDLNGRQTFSEPSNEIEGSHHSYANDQSQIYNPTNLEIDNISKNNNIQGNNCILETDNYIPENNNVLEKNYPLDNNYSLKNSYTLENNNTLENNYTLDNKYSLENIYTPKNNNTLETNNYTLDNNYTVENNYTPENNNTLETNNYTLETDYPLENSCTPEIIDDFESDRTETETPNAPAYTEYQYASSTDPSISSDHFLDPSNETVNCNNEFYDATGTNKNDHQCASNETNMDYYSRRKTSDDLEVNGNNNLCVYDESGGYNISRDSDQFDDKQSQTAYNVRRPDLGDRNLDKYEVDSDNNPQYYDESASCSDSDRSFDGFETGQIDDNLENNRRLFAISFDNRQPSFPSSNTVGRGAIARGAIDLPKEPPIELVRSTDCTQELEKMKTGQTESLDFGGSGIELPGGAIEELGEGERRRRRRESLTQIQNERKLQSQNEIKESLRDELEDELEVGLEEVLNPDIQGMEDSILQLLAQSEAAMESLEIRVKAERNRGEISPKPLVEMEGYKKRREEHERIREEKRQKLLGSLGAIVDGNLRQPSTYSTCNFCNLECSEGIEIQSGDFKSTIVTNKEIMELIQRNEVESENLLQRIQNTLKTSANPIVYDIA